MSVKLSRASTLLFNRGILLKFYINGGGGRVKI